MKKDHNEEVLELETTIRGVYIKAKIDFVNRLISIQVDDKEYKMVYINAIGHMVSFRWTDYGNEILPRPWIYS